MVFSEASYENLMRGFSDLDGFIFASLTEPANIHDSIVVRVPWDATASYPRYPLSSRTVEEYVEFINLHGIRKAIVIAENIDFLLQCPTLEFLQIIPAYGAPDHFDFSPLYHIPCVKWLRCQTVYGMREEKHGDINYAQIRGLRCLYVSETKHELHFNQVPGLQSLNLSNFRGSDLSALYFLLHPCHWRHHSGLGYRAGGHVSAEPRRQPEDPGLPVPFWRAADCLCQGNPGPDRCSMKNTSQFGTHFPSFHICSKENMQVVLPPIQDSCH